MLGDFWLFGYLKSLSTPTRNGYFTGTPDSTITYPDQGNEILELDNPSLYIEKKWLVNENNK